MRFKAEKIPPTKSSPSMFLLIIRYCDNCELAFWLERVSRDGTIPICPQCGGSLWMSYTVKMRIK